MAFSVNRIVGIEDLLKRPRVSYRISEYVLNFIDKEILKPAKILQSDKYVYEFTLSFSFGIPKPNKILYKSPYATDKRLFIPHKGFTTFEKTTKKIHLTFIGDDIGPGIAPTEYADIVYTMLTDYLLYNYKKLKKETFDNKKGLLDEKKINSFPHPAPFGQQKYILDESGYVKNWDDYVNNRKDKWIYIKDEYLKHYKF
ncbi:MAG: hypothetical protein JST75_20980 [Bacteroidetes bacterium]|nr:hypothetical protein [Bacteroidota bacterium]